MSEEGMEKEQHEEGIEEGIIETPEEEIKRLKDQLDAAAKDTAVNYDKYLRAVAELENYKKRAEKEKADAIAFANEKILEEILPVYDNFERALHHANGEENVESLRKGIELTASQFSAVFKKFGLQEVKALCEKFDPAMHHAISEEENSEVEPGTVVKEFQKGYTLKGRLLRPAMVAVSRKP